MRVNGILLLMQRVFFADRPRYTIEAFSHDNWDRRNPQA